LLAPTIRAQQTAQKTLWNSDQVPRDLVIAMFQAQYGGSSVPDLMIGDVPASLKSKVPMLSGGRVLGTMLSASNSQIYLEVPGRADTLTAAIWRELPKLGWSRYEQPQSVSFGGFRPPMSSMTTPSAWCSESATLTFGLVPRGDATTLVRYTIQDTDNGICSRRLATGGSVTSVGGTATRVVQSVDMRTGPGWPTLYSPLGSDYFAAACRGTGMGRSTNSTNASIRTTMSPQDLMDYYSRQLADSGWTPAAANDSGAVSKTFMKKDSDGSSRRTTLTIFVPRGTRSDCRDQTMSTEVSR